MVYDENTDKSNIFQIEKIDIDEINKIIIEYIKQ